MTVGKSKGYALFNIAHLEILIVALVNSQRVSIVPLWASHPRN